jgi:hypothetical protein
MRRPDWYGRHSPDGYIDFPNQLQCEYNSPSVAHAGGCGRGRMKNL